MVPLYSRWLDFVQVEAKVTVKGKHRKTAWIVPNSACGISRVVRITFLFSKFKLTRRQAQHILPKRRNRFVMLHVVRSQTHIPCRSTHYESLKRHRMFLDPLHDCELILVQAKLSCGWRVSAKTFVLEVRDALDFPTAVDFLSVEYMINERFHRWLMRVYATYDCDVTIFDDLPIAMPLYSAHICCCCFRRMINWSDW